MAFASIRDDRNPTNSYRLGLKVTKIAPDAALMAAWRVPTCPPRWMRSIWTPTPACPPRIDRHAGEAKPTLTGFDLTEARLIWGDLAFSASGSLKPGKDGLAEGSITMTVKNWRVLPPVLVALGIVKPEIEPTITRAMEVAAAQSPDMDVITMTLRCTDGWMYFGPLPLGPAPKLG